MIIGVNARVLVSNHLEGLARYTYETTRHMAIANPQDQFILFFDRQIDFEFDFPSNIDKVVIPLQARHPVLWRIWLDLLVPRYLRKYNVDVFYSPDGYMSLTTKVPTLMVLHDIAFRHYPAHIPWQHRFDYQFFVPRYIQKSKHIITVSDYVRNDIIEKFSISPSKISVAYNALDQSKILTNPSAIMLPEKPYFVYIGSLNPRKNLIRLIESFNLFNTKNDFKYCLVLAGKISKSFTALENVLKKTKNVIHTGPVSENDKYKLIGGAEALTYISLYEGFGIPILEGFAMGTPLITSNAASMPEVAGGAALLVNPFEINQIENAMNTIVSDNNYRNELIQKGKKRLADFSWKLSAAHIYGQLVSIKNDSYI
jgi:glycosyltransferase involved in cell wall biosynthesis